MKEQNTDEGCCMPPKSKDRCKIILKSITCWCFVLFAFYLNIPVSAQKTSPECYLKAQKAFNKQKYAEALRFNEQCLAQDSQQASSWLMKAECLRRMGKENFSQAYFCYQKVLNLSPNSSSVYNNLFVLAAKQDRWKDGLMYLRQGMKAEKHAETQQYFAYKIQIVKTLILFHIL
jgi:tetratricopeptide (TPR) repeat protein